MTTKVRKSTLDLTDIAIPGSIGISGGPRSSLPSAATVNVSGLNTTTQNLLITGTVNITGFQILNGQTYFTSFSGILTLTNSSSLVTNKGGNIITAAGDSCIIRAIADNVVEIICYCRGSLV